ncbi:MAG: HIT domain-containing protein [Phycisphaerae bacterium]|nr:HIT domain-containing protein [Phycisphaerae bacterium]
MTEFRGSLWAPWRLEYVASICERNEKGCFLCGYWSEPGKDAENHVLWRTERCYVVMNLYPYTNGHVLICPAAHKGGLEELDDAEMLEMMQLTRDVTTILGRAVNAQGTNVGMNFGHCAGAGLPEHLHIHVVPRWAGDTNFMTVLGDVRVIPQALDAVYHRMLEVADELNLPNVTTGDRK